MMKIQRYRPFSTPSRSTMGKLIDIIIIATQKENQNHLYLLHQKFCRLICHHSIDSTCRNFNEKNAETSTNTQRIFGKHHILCPIRHHCRIAVPSYLFVISKRGHRRQEKYIRPKPCVKVSLHDSKNSASAPESFHLFLTAHRYL